jgi:sulfur relay (sulfurtransferase) complex TusBCD TusD component (DsrE family)
MVWQDKTLSILVSAGPTHPAFLQSLRLAETALNRGVIVFMFCLDDAVQGLNNPGLSTLRQKGLRLYACAYGARRRGLTLGDQAVFAGLGTLADLVARSDRFLSFSA